jgi:hypothetical protein
MAGLLDIFGTSGQETMGLLGMSPEDVQKNRDSAQAQALYALAGRLFQGGRGASSVLEGLQQGQQAYKTAMQGSLQQQLQNAQIQEMLRKRQQEQQALMRQQGIEQEIAKAYRPETFADTPLTNLMGQEIAGPNMPQEAGGGLQALAPRLMTSPEGRRSLTELLAAQEAMSGKTTTLAEGANLIRINPITNKVETVAQGAKKRDTVTVGNTVLDKNTMEVLYTAPDAPSGSIKEFQDFMKLPKNEQAAYIQLQDQKRPTTTINMPSEGERKAAVLASRLNFSVGQMNEAIGADPKAAMPSTTAEIARFVSRTDFLPNKLTTEQRQIVEAAQEDILDAALTLGTGAAYTREQLAGYKKSYFPQLEDKPAQIKTKQERLNNLLKSAEVASGRAAGQITAPIPKLPSTTTQPEQTSPFQYDAAKEDRYQQWLKKQQGG